MIGNDRGSAFVAGVCSVFGAAGNRRRAGPYLHNPTRGIAKIPRPRMHRGLAPPRPRAAHH